MSDKHPLQLMLGDLKWESIEQVLPPRLPLVDQCLDLARLMKDVNSKEEYARVLNIAGDCLRMYSQPVFVVKETK
jgi:hypothetical protein